MTGTTSLCYGSSLTRSSYLRQQFSTSVPFFSTISLVLCHELFLFWLAFFSLLTFNLSAQTFQPALPAPPQTLQASPNPNQKIRIPRADVPDSDSVYIESITQEVNGSWRYMRGAVRIETTDMQLKADEVDYNEDTGEAEARGHVHFEHFVRGEKIDYDKADYNIDDETGKFYNVIGSATAQVAVRPGLLTTTNPYYFQAQWAERLQDHYILHDGFLTDCIVPRPWWIFKGPVFDIVPGDHAIVRHSWFYLKRLPLFYAPYFYKSLKKEPRKSGFLVPSFGNSSLHGEMINFGYYWAINRSFDLTYRGQYFTSAGLANHVEDSEASSTSKPDSICPSSESTTGSRPIPPKAASAPPWWRRLT